MEIKFEADINEEDAKYVRSILLDGLHQFVKFRENVDKYMEGYADMDEDFQRKKRQEVETRLEAASKLIKGVHQLQV